MKRFLLLLLSFLLLSGAFALADNAGEDPFPALYPEGHTVLASAVYGNSAAAVLRGPNGCFLTMLQKQDTQWRVLFENPRAVTEDCTVYLDAEDILILSIPMGECTSEQFYFTLQDEWRLSSVIRYIQTLYPEDEPNTEEHAALKNGLLYRETIYTNENDNILARHSKAPLPDVLTEEEHLLSAFCWFEPGFNGNGYLTADSMSVSDTILRRFFSVIIPSGYAYADGALCDDTLQFIADKPNGDRVLLCCAYADSRAEWQITESTPLPAGTRMGIENFTTTLNLGLQGVGFSITRYDNGQWGASGYLNQGLWFDIGPCWIGEGGYWWTASPVIGDTPWSDITRMDWSLLPGSFEEAASLIDPANWATPNNPNPADRLHLRKKADQSSDSLGKYYNGTPVRVLERGREWTKVQIGRQTGYMMTKYLAFGKDINRLPTALTGKIQSRPMINVTWDGALPETVPGFRSAEWVIIGVIDPDWYLIWQPDLDRFGRVRQSELWDGNG